MPEFVSSGNVLRLHFQTDDSETMKGFVAEYLTAEPGIGPTTINPLLITTHRPSEPVINEKVHNPFTQLMSKIVPDIGMNETDD